MRIQMDTVRRAPISFERNWGETERKQGKALRPEPEHQVFSLSSESFPDGGPIPERYAEEEGISPQLSWMNAPGDTQSFVIIMDDPDARQAVGHTFVHWVAALPASSSSLEEGASAGGWTGERGISAQDLQSTAYRGPRPPQGTHRYHIAVYAMKSSFDDAEFENLADSAAANDTRSYTRERFESLYGSDINAKAEITGIYTAQNPH